MEEQELQELINELVYYTKRVEEDGDYEINCLEIRAITDRLNDEADTLLFKGNTQVHKRLCHFARQSYRLCTVDSPRSHASIAPGMY